MLRDVNKLERNLFFVCLILAASGLVSAPLALAMGLVFALTFTHPYSTDAHHLAQFLLQASVVLLGFGMNLGQVLEAGRSGLGYSAIGIGVTLTLGLGIGRLLGIERVSSTLISAGTAICGGSAIAAMGPVLDAGEEAMAVALGAVFVLNSVALFLFPWLGHRMGLDQNQFGLWAALAIHDTSSVVGAAARYGPAALAVAVPVKLVRALWIVPVALGFAAVGRRSGVAREDGAKPRVSFPIFLIWFLLAAVVATYLPRLLPALGGLVHPLFATLTGLGKTGLAVTLFLIGSRLNRRAMARVGVKPFVQAVVLWIVAATATLLAIRAGWIHL